MFLRTVGERLPVFTSSLHPTSVLDVFHRSNICCSANSTVPAASADLARFCKTDHVTDIASGTRNYCSCYFVTRIA
jgi:hypothetical protein